jgi:hypothetical protein
MHWIWLNHSTYTYFHPIKSQHFAVLRFQKFEMVGHSETWIVVLSFYQLQLAAAEPTHHPGVSLLSGQMTTAQIDGHHVLLINGNEMHRYIFSSSTTLQYRYTEAYWKRCQSQKQNTRFKHGLLLCSQPQVFIEDRWKHQIVLQSSTF